ncbi:glycosyltransferase [Tardiphaga sp. vice154]|uniref:glycosyltransferase family 2 protein n=1 Tax=Tardiphaga sp. vice154 TaxID=2592814 RepID=UPI0011628C14|nr:glycosyltransferase family 2 protein [Tardiphaga sp. vice154]QDM22626.1 glycosyltransferase [Tardiphaga sp. vice154]
MTAKPRKRVSVAGSPLSTALSRIDRAIFTGFVYDPGDLARTFTVELLLDGLVVATAHSDKRVAALVEAGIGDGCYGFTIGLPEQGLAAAQTVEARLANGGAPVGLPIACAAADPPDPGAQAGDLKWLGGLRFDGWLALDLNDSVDILIDQQPVMRIRPSGWSHVELAGGVQAVKRLDLHLPERFADGRVHWLSATVDGRHLTPDALPFVAFDNGLEQALQGLGRWDSERLRGRLFDQLVPASLPFSAYQAWKERFPPDAGRASPLKAAVMLVGDHHDHHTDGSVESLEAQLHAGWTAVSLPGRGVTRFDPAAALAFLSGEAADCDFVVFCLSGTVLFEGALQALAGAFATHDNALCVYADIDVQMADGSVWPLALPAFDRERMLEQGYAAHFFALRRDAALAGLCGAASLYDLLLRAADAAGACAIRHLPGALAVMPPLDLAVASAELADATRAALQRAHSRATVEPTASTVLPAVRVRRPSGPRARTTIMIPTRNRAALLRRCIESILPAVERCGASIAIIDNDSREAETLDYLAGIVSDRISVIRAPGAFNYARINNLAARQLDADNLCLLNNDIEAEDDLWLAELLSRLADPEVGAVGAKLVWPSGVIQHGGVVLGPSFAAAHAGNDRMDGDAGYADMLRVAHECSAVTAACLLLRRSDYLAVGGMDEIRFPVAFNDVDLCLKLRQLGRRIVFTPHATLLHLESATRGKDEAPDRKARFERELRMLRTMWGEALINDPYYSPVLSLDPSPFSALAWPPRSFAARINAPPQAVDVLPGI